MKKRSEIPTDVAMEIDFMLGSIEECNSEYLKPILINHGIDPDGGWVDAEAVGDDVIVDIYEKLFVTGMLEPFLP